MATQLLYSFNLMLAFNDVQSFAPEADTLFKLNGSTALGQSPGEHALEVARAYASWVDVRWRRKREVLGRCRGRRE
jgi:hypothetical protein